MEENHLGEDLYANPTLPRMMVGHICFIRFVALYLFVLLKTVQSRGQSRWHDNVSA